MAISFDGLVIDRVLAGVAEDSSNNILYRLTQLSEAKIDTTADSTESKDAQGILIKKTYKAKAVSFSATNALLDLNVIGETSGSPKQTATATNKITMPRMILVDGDLTETTLPAEPITGTLTVTGINANGTIAKQYKLGTTANTTDFAYTTGTKKLTFPTGQDNVQYMIKYDYKSENGIMVDSRADKFPRTVKFTLSVLAYDPCTVDVLRHCYIVFPSFQVSPETSLTFSADATFDFSGDCQVDYCSKDKQLYYIVMAEDDVEE